MAEATPPATLGVNHVGLAVPDLAAARSFFIEAMWFHSLGEMPEYPACFVTDGTTMITLWQVEDPTEATPFDRRRNVGLHHLAFTVAPERMQGLFERLSSWPGVRVDFAPMHNDGEDDATHFMIFMPGGPRLEFCCSPALPA